MAVSNLLYARRLEVNEKIILNIPTVGEVLDREDDYYSVISLLSATPYDMAVQLDDIGIDFAEISDYELLLLTFKTLSQYDSSLVFVDLKPKNFTIVTSSQNGELILYDDANDITIDRGIHINICNALCKINSIDRSVKTPGNASAKSYMIERMRVKMKRQRNKPKRSQLEDLIVALVNTEQCGYSFNTIRDMTIYQFNESVRQIIKKIDYGNRMHGIYAGTISAKDISQDDLNWLTH